MPLTYRVKDDRANIRFQTREELAALGYSDEDVTPGVRCWLCGEPIRWRAEGTLDHVIPVAEGGARGPVRAAHRRCNMRRNAARTNEIRRTEGTARRVWPGALDPDRDDNDARP